MQGGESCLVAAIDLGMPEDPRKALGRTSNGETAGMAAANENGGAGRVAAALVVAKRATLLALVWLALTSAAGDGLVVGALAVAAATFLSLRLLPPSRPVRLWHLVFLLPGFLWRSLLGGIDVVWRACHPRLPLRPGWLDLPSALPDGGKAVLGGEFSLMPGTLVAGSRQGRLLVHLLDSGQDHEPALRREEARLARTFSTQRLEGPGAAAEAERLDPAGR